MYNKKQTMSATARLVVQMTPREKTALVQKARKAGVSTAEFVRRRIKDDGIQADENKDEIEALLTAIEATAPSILKSLQNTIAITDAMTAMLNGGDDQVPA
jgi:hypothetical protein